MTRSMEPGKPRPPRPRDRERQAIGLFDRLALGVLATFLGGLTLIGYALVGLYGANGRAGGTADKLAILSTGSLVFLGVCFVAGFLSNPERFASFFAFLWGTHPVWEEARFQKVATAVLIVVLACLFAFLHSP